MNKLLKLNTNKKSSRPKKNKGAFKEKIQLFARGLLVPITLLAFAGLFLGIGAVMAKYIEDGAGHILANVVKNVGYVVFYLLPLLFAVAIASSMTNNNGTAILTAIVVWVAVQMLAGAQFASMTSADGKTTTGYSWFNVIDFKIVGGAAVITKPFGFNTLDLSVFGGFIAGPIAIYAFNRFKDQRMPIFLQMFQGQRFVPIMGLVLSIPTSIIVALIWPWFSKGFIEFGQQTGKLPGGLDSFLFGVLERALLPTGLHHMFYSPLLYTEAGATVMPSYKVASEVTASGIHYAAGTPLWLIDAGPFTSGHKDLMPNVQGLQIVDYSNTPGVNYVPGKSLSVTSALVEPTDLNELQGDRTSFQQLNGSVIQFSWINDLQSGHSVHLGRFSAGKFPLMVFGIPAAGLAMILTAPKENRKLVSGVVGSAALTSLLTGITEPFEYSFLFLAPVLFYGFHIWMAGLSYMLANIAGVYYGPTFGGIIDFFIYGVAPHASGQYTGFYWLLLIGVGLAAVYFFGFFFAIKKFDLKTPGRSEGEIKMVSKADYKEAKGKSGDKLAMKGQIMYKALGGRENLKIITNCASRLRVTVIDPEKVDYELANTTQPFGVVGKGKSSQQYIYGPAVQTIADTVLGIFEGKIKPMNLDAQAPAKEETKNKAVSAEAKIMAPASGIIKDVKELKDGVFSEGMMGEGVFIKLPRVSEKQIMRAPVSGELLTVFPTGHAYGIKTDEGVEVLLHIGVDTVNLKGEGFTPLVKQGDRVNVGDKLVEVNTKQLKGKVPSFDPVLLITSGQKIKNLKKDSNVKVNELAFEVE